MEDKTRAAGLGNAAAKATPTSVWVWGQEPKASAGAMGRKQRQETKAVVTAGAGVTAAADEGAGKNVTAASVDERKMMFADVKSGSSCRYVTLGGGGAWQDRYADKYQTLRSSFRAAVLPRHGLCSCFSRGPLRVCAFFVRARVSSRLFFLEKGWCWHETSFSFLGKMCVRLRWNATQAVFSMLLPPPERLRAALLQTQSHCTLLFLATCFSTAIDLFRSSPY